MFNWREFLFTADDPRSMTPAQRKMIEEVRAEDARQEKLRSSNTPPAGRSKPTPPPGRVMRESHLPAAPAPAPVTRVQEQSNDLAVMYLMQRQEQERRDQDQRRRDQDASDAERSRQNQIILHDFGARGTMEDTPTAAVPYEGGWIPTFESAPTPAPEPEYSCSAPSYESPSPAPYESPAPSP